MRYDLPTSVEVNGTEYEIRSDYRDILTIIEAISDAELGDQDKAEVMLDVFYPAFCDMPQSDYEEAVRQCALFINCGKEQREEKRGPKLMDWQQDFSLTWIAAYQEIGDCTFAQVVSIRSKRAKGKKLDKSEQEFYKNNRDLVDFKRQYTAADEQTISKWV